MADEQRIRLALEILGAEGVESLRQRLNALQGESGELAAALGRGEISAAEFDAEMKRVAATARGLQSALNGLDKAAGKTRNLGMAALEASRGLEDLQYGVAGVVNNIPSLVMSLGGGAGLTAAISLLAVGANQLFKHWGDLQGAFGTGIPRPVLDTTKELEEQLKRDTKEFDALGEKSILTLKELTRYQELKEKIDAAEAKKKEQKETEAVEGIKGKGTEETIAAAKDAIAEAGGGEAVERQLIQALVNIGDQTGQQYSIEGITRQAQEMMRGAMRGNTGSIDEMRRTIKGGMPEDQRFLADALVTPDEQRRADEEDAAFERRMDRARDAGARRREAAARAKKTEADAKKAEKDAKKAKDDKDKALVDMLNAQGVSNEKDGKDKQDAENKAIDVEQKKIEATVGKDYQHRYELATAANNAAIATGDPRAVDPARLKAQLQNEMFAMLRQRRAGTDAARGAITSITGKGDEDLGRRAADASSQNLGLMGQAVAVQSQLIGEYQRMSTTQREMRRELADQGKRLRATQATQRTSGKVR